MWTHSPVYFPYRSILQREWHHVSNLLCQARGESLWGQKMDPEPLAVTVLLCSHSEVGPLPGWMSGVLSNNSCPSHHPSKLWGSSQHGMGDSHNQHLVRFMQILIECLAPSPLHKHLEITKESVSRIFGGQSFCWGLGWEDGFKYSSKTMSKVFSIFLGRFSELHDISTPCPSP